MSGPRLSIAVATGFAAAGLAEKSRMGERDL